MRPTSLRLVVLRAARLTRGSVGLRRHAAGGEDAREQGGQPLGLRDRRPTIGTGGDTCAEDHDAGDDEADSGLPVLRELVHFLTPFTGGASSIAACAVSAPLR